MSDLSDAVQRYLEIWNITDPDARLKKVREVWAEGATYTDPLAAVAGPDGLDAVVAGAQQQFAGLTFEPGTVYDEHHNVVRFTWHLVPSPGAEPVAVGFDVAVLDDAGKISSVIGFIDRMPG
jgi:hypothetical protein